MLIMLMVFYSNQIAEDDRKDFTTAVGAVKQRNANLGTFIDRFAQVVKMPEPEFHPESVNALLERIALLYQERCRSQGIHLRWEHNEDSKPVLLDRYLMEQALMNILKNAIEAFDGASGEIALSIRSVNDFLQVSVSDSANGLQGIAPEKLFSPFFTTKRSGQGLGLLLVREVLQRHRFTYQLAPTGLGATRFDIWMPLGKALQPTSHQAYQR